MKTILTALALAGLIFACSRINPGAEPPVKNCFCFGSKTCDSLCSKLPYFADLKISAGYATSLDPVDQVPFDVFSWQTFVALNWPADSNGKPMPGPMSANPNAFRVWEYYNDPAVVFQQDPNQTLVLRLKASFAKGMKFLYMDSKSPKAIDPLGHFLEADGYPVIDRNQNFALYEIKVNGDETKYIRNNNLYTLEGIYKYTRVPNQQITLPYSNIQTKQDGAMEIKTAWRILDTLKGDNPKEYYTRMATIYVPAESNISGHELVIPNVLVGLVGMHIIRQIAQKDSTSQSEKLVWSTFEHVKNAPDVANNGGTTNWSFFNGGVCAGLPINTPPALFPDDNNNYRWDTVPPYAKRYATGSCCSQIKRMLPPAFSSTTELNAQWQKALQNTVWANYKLIGTQWFKGGEDYAVNTPVIMGNTVIESFMQGTSSCIGCHGFASVNYTPPPPAQKVNIPTGFSFLFPIMAK